MIRVCAWHPLYFKEPLTMGEIEPLEDKSETHGICSCCLKIARSEAKMTAKKEIPRDCTHHWQIEPPDGKFSPGVCKLCGETREFQNTIEQTPWERLKEEKENERKN